MATFYRTLSVIINRLCLIRAPGGMLEQFPGKNTTEACRAHVQSLIPQDTWKFDINPP